MINICATGPSMPVARHLRCTSPVRVYWPALCVWLNARCRRCSGCMKTRQWSWVSKAAHEQAFATKTWFVTLTFGPNRRRAIMSAASALGDDQDTDQRLVRASGVYVAKYIRSLRKKGLECRYLFVPELHRDGFPHWHGLVHDLKDTLTWATLSTGWSAGFSVCKIVRDAKALRYVTKYLSKDRLGRVRASINYGSPAGSAVELAPTVTSAEGTLAPSRRPPPVE